MEYLLKIAGFLQIALAIAHIFFPRHFGWKKEFANLTTLSRQMFYVHTFFLCVTLVFFGLVTILFSDDFLSASSTMLAQFLLGFIATFWFLRLITQLFVYNSSLWKGKVFETIVHILFTLLWITLTAIYGLSLLPQFKMSPHA